MQKPKVKEISERMWGIPELGHIVSLQVKKGRRIWTCSCTSHSKFCVENSWCYDKQLVSEFLAFKQIKKELEKLRNDYQGFENIKANIPAKTTLNELNKLWRLVR